MKKLLLILIISLCLSGTAFADMVGVEITPAGAVLKGYSGGAGSNVLAIDGGGLIGVREATLMFHVVKSSNQSITDQATYVKVSWQTEIIDEGDNFDLGNNKFVAPVGSYWLKVSTDMSSLTSGKITYAAIFKNGSLHARGQMSGGGGSHAIATAVALVESDGDDEFEAYFWQNDSTSEQIGLDNTATMFQGFKIQ